MNALLESDPPLRKPVSFSDSIDSEDCRIRIISQAMEMYSFLDSLYNSYASGLKKGSTSTIVESGMSHWNEHMLI
jgi:hypothetical protein